jgi:hypothetical protein
MRGIPRIAMPRAIGVAPAPGKQSASVIPAKSGAHSAKPNQFAEMIEEMFRNLPGIDPSQSRASTARTARTAMVESA